MSLFEKFEKNYLNYKLAKQGSDLAFKLMNRKCICGCLCKDHNFVNSESKDFPEAKVPDSCKNCDTCLKFKQNK